MVPTVFMVKGYESLETSTIKFRLSMVKISISFKLMSPIMPTYYVWLRDYFRMFPFLRETSNKCPSNMILTAWPGV